MAPDQAELRRRIRAARELAEPSATEIDRRVETRDPKRQGDVEAGISVVELAARLEAAGYQGLKKDTLDAINRGIRVIRRQELAAIAAVCDLPYSFFTVDFAALPEEIPELGPDDLLVAQVRQVLRGPDFKEALLAALEQLGPEVLRSALERAEHPAPVDPLEQEARAAGRQLSGAAADLMDTYAQDDAAVDDTRDEADASQEAPAARSAGKRSGA